MVDTFPLVFLPWTPRQKKIFFERTLFINSYSQKSWQTLSLVSWDLGGVGLKDCFSSEWRPSNPIPPFPLPQRSGELKDNTPSGWEGPRGILKRTCSSPVSPPERSTIWSTALVCHWNPFCSPSTLAGKGLELVGGGPRLRAQVCSQHSPKRCPFKQSPTSLSGN